MVLLIPVAPRGGRVVTGGGVDSDTLVRQGGVDVGIDSQGVAILPGIISDGHDKNVGGQDGRVVEGGQQNAIVNVLIIIAKNLRHDELRVGRGTPELRAVGGCKGRDVRAVGVSNVIGLVGVFISSGVCHIRVTVGVVVGEGDLRTHPAAAPPVTKRGRQGGHVRLRQARALHGTCECAVARVEAGVDDLDDLPRPHLGGLGSRRHIRRGRERGVMILALATETVGAVHVIDRGAVAIHEGGLHARRRPDRCEG